MKLVNANDWKAVHFQNRTILRSDRNLYPEPDWWALVSTVEVEPMAEPVSTIGASAPTEPPKPMVMELAMMDDQVLCRLMRPCRREMAYRILVTP